MDNATIKVIFFDFGGVIAEEGFAQGIRVIAAQNGREPEVFFEDVRQVIFKTGYVYGRCDEQAFWTALQTEMNLRVGGPETWREEILSRFVPRPWMIDLVRATRTRGLQAAILSDQVNWLAELNQKHGFFGEFHKVFNSWDYGWTKSEPEFFHLALEAMGVRPNEALLIDDATTNVTVARQVGLSAILYEDRTSFARELAACLPNLTDTTAVAAGNR
ncbi:HAD family hydrolase [Desulfocurvibacter africanus]|uniref:HAD-superfamily hydrolase, subfamily IA, variant 3 n=1 Tax=Desulfocurvibacter africanus subsp. africanus str. Walvis Bay TaxID=690850 RepID=F3Z3U1_DESAF|nr:HAD family phosphatase [Desulfocurvibacter africanus]EGJ51556.1 HAD-superfamily hydrolase, subfamily IA, variant 3 [Desulfocurvibacter africanus subsp. africanus str. Walvis Bay]